MLPLTINSCIVFREFCESIWNRLQIILFHVAKKTLRSVHVYGYIKAFPSAPTWYHIMLIRHSVCVRVPTLLFTWSYDLTGRLFLLEYHHCVFLLIQQTRTLLDHHLVCCAVPSIHTFTLNWACSAHEKTFTCLVIES